MSIDKIRASLKGGKLKDAQRLQAFSEGKKRDNESILMEFEEETLPRRVVLGYMAYIVGYIDTKTNKML